MLAEARRVGLPPQAQLAVGRAEHLPFAAGTFDAAWLSAVIHHVADRAACARELARVLAPGGRVYLRGFFAGSSQLGWLPYFPGSERAIARFPSIAELDEIFSRVGFSVARVDEVRTPPRSVADAREWTETMRHADTLLTALTDAEIAAGLAALDATESTQLEGSLHLVTLLVPG
jgi:SAM-dependent methyltransferase